MIYVFSFNQASLQQLRPFLEQKSKKIELHNFV